MAGALGEEVLKRVKALRKKLTQIEKLKARGGQFTEEEQTKVNSEEKILAEIEALESGKEVPAFSEAQQPPKQKAPAASPTPRQQAPAAKAARPTAPETAVRAEPPVSLAEGVPSAEDDAHVAEALAQAFAQEDTMEEEGFMESRASTRKRAIQAKAQAKAAELKAQAKAAQEAEEAAAARRRQEMEEGQRRQQQLRQQEEQGRQAAIAAAREQQLEFEQQQQQQLQQQQLQQQQQQEQRQHELRQQEEREAMGDHAVSDKPAPEKRLRALKKKISQIEKLKQRGGEYTAEEREKLAAEANMLAEIAALERGETWTPPSAPADPAPAAAVEEEAEAPPAPTQEAAPAELAAPAEVATPPASPQIDVHGLSPAEAEKRLRALRKKLTQIGKLKERGSPFSDEEAVKIASEPQILKDIRRLEAHLT